MYKNLKELYKDDDLFNDDVQNTNYHNINKFINYSGGSKAYNDVILKLYEDVNNCMFARNFEKYSRKKNKEIFLTYYKDSKNRIFLKMLNIPVTLIGIGGYGQIYKLSEDICIKINIETTDSYHEYEIPKSLSTIIDDDIKELVLYPSSIMKNCVFNGLCNTVQLNIVFVYIIYCIVMDKKVSKEEIENKTRNYNIDTEFNYIFSLDPKNEKFLKESCDMYNFIISNYMKKENRIGVIKNLPRILKMFHTPGNQIKNKGFIIFMPLLKSQSMNLLLNKETGKIDTEHGIRAYLVCKNYHRMLFLQMSILILSINKRTKFVHNDFKPDNMLVETKTEPYELNYEEKTFIFNEPFVFKLADFDFSIMNNFSNKKIENRKNFINNTWLSDIHYFVHLLFYFISSEEYESDKVFFDSIHNKFIKPYCNISVQDLLFKKGVVKKINEHVKCLDGRLMINKEVDIKILSDYIDSELFSIWRK